MGCSPHICLALVLLLQLPPASYSKTRNEEIGRLSRAVDLVHPPSPCPSVFSYEGKESEKDKWFGVILITTDQELTGMRLDIQLDRPASLLGNWVGEVTSTDNVRFTILNLDKKIKPGPPHSVRIFVKFPKNQDIPRLKSISLNGREICPDHINPPATVKPIIISPVTIRQTLPPVTKPTRPTPLMEEIQPDSSSQPEKCGRVAVQPAPLITNGQSTSRGQFPWHTALYQSKDIHLKYICGGSLIGPRTVLTAAHCVTKATVNHPLNPDLFLVYLGKYHLKQWSEGGVQDKQVVEIYVHPQYNTTNYQNDLAILILSSPVEYTTYVRPVCLWDKDKVDLSNVIGKQGIVAGWGFDENGQITEDLKMANMPIVSQTDCLWSNLNFFPHFTTNMTFCAGFQNGTSVCNGDSGGGMVLPKKVHDGTVIWMLRGVVSLSKPKENQQICDPTHYVVFTDVSKYMDWIENYIK